jgi:putative hemolysin
MRILLAIVLLLPACAKPAPPAPVPRPECFAPAGFYLSVASLQEHNCAQPPKDTIVESLEIGPEEIACGLHKHKLPAGRTGQPAVTLLIAANSHGLAGKMVAEFADCRATYEIVYLRMK